MIGIFIFALKNFGVLPYNNFTIYTMTAGSSIEVILLSFGLDNRINILKQEKEEAQQNELQQRKEKEQLLEQQTAMLKIEVEKATDELKQTQTQLIQSEKMASLGQLTAGIAHEINNPINFVKTNVRPLKRDINLIYQLIEKYEAIQSPEGLSAQLKSIAVFKEKIEIDFLKEEITALFLGIDDGASRTAKIVEGLKAFSRLGDTSFQKYDLDLGIESCLTILQHRLSISEIDIQKNYTPPLLIECLPDSINQVFMNLLDNAIDALLTVKGQKIIAIKVKRSGNKIEISFTDNGIGMTNEMQKKIFDPFYTSKVVGSGTGLGLSIAYGIVQDHNGTIQVASSEGEGTTFTIIF
jgi:signal transduction histidine kinase